MFNWFISKSPLPKLFQNDTIRNEVWENCAPDFRRIVEEGISAKGDDEQLVQIIAKFYPIICGMIWQNKRQVTDDLKSVCCLV
jgi:hypothetical protein